MEKKRYKRGFVLGKFMPLHTGHMYLIASAKALAEEVTILVCTLEKEPIKGIQRFEWVKRTFPDLDVIHVMEEVPSYPHEHPRFWEYWMEIFSKYLPLGMEVFVCGEDYGKEVSERMGIASEIVYRDGIVSATAIRQDPLLHWPFIPRHVRPFYAKRIVLTGPESTGKTSLAQQLATHFQTRWVPEYGREHFVNCQGKLTLDDISIIATTQLEREEKEALEANKLLFCDTDLLVTQVWSYIYFQSCPKWIETHNNRRKYDLYLLMDIDLPWEDDGTREFPHLREHHFKLLKEELEKRHLPFVIISGKGEYRLNKAIQEIEKHFGTSTIH